MPNFGQIENFDSASTTPVDERILKFIIPYFCDRFSNPSSSYTSARKNHDVIETAKKSIAKSLNCLDTEVYFTSGGTESNNWILKEFPYTEDKKTVLISATEHLSVMKTAEVLEQTGHIILKKIPVDSNGQVDLTFIEETLKTENVALISVHYVNNETGAIQPIEAIYELAKKYDSMLHTDASQAFGKLPITLTADYMTLSGHKVYAPKGIGALVIKEGAAKLGSLLIGGSHQHGMRAGTLAVPLIVGFGKACEYFEENYKKAQEFKPMMETIKNIFKNYGNVVLNSDSNCLPLFLNFSVPCDSSSVIALMEKQSGISLAKGASCMEGRSSYVLKAMGRSDKDCKNSIRISLCKYNKKEKLSVLPHLIEKCIKEVSKED